MKNSIESKNSRLDRGHTANTQQGHRHMAPLYTPVPGSWLHRPFVPFNFAPTPTPPVPETPAK